MESFTVYAAFFNPCKSRSFGKFILYIGTFSYCLDGVVNTYKHPDNKEGSSNGTHPVHRHNLCNGFKEVTIKKCPVRVKLFPHRSLGETGYIHRECIDDDPQGAYPEMEVSQR